MAARSWSTSLGLRKNAPAALAVAVAALAAAAAVGMAAAVVAVVAPVAAVATAAAAAVVVVTAAAAAVVVAQVAVATAVVAAVAQAVAAATVVVVAVAQVVAAAAVTDRPGITSNGGFSAVCLLLCSVEPSCAQALSPRRSFRARPATARSNKASGRQRISLATTPICQGMTRYRLPAAMARKALSANTSAGIRNGMA